MVTTAICIINYNTRDLLRACLHSVLAENADEIVVVDSASTDNSAEMVRREFPSVKLICLEKNVGYGAASNQAMQNCHADHILLLNSDTVVKPGTLNILSRHLETKQIAAFLGPRISNPDGTPQTSCFHFPEPLHIFLYLSGLYKLIPRLPILSKRTLQKIGGNSATVVPWVLGAALAFRREAFEALGGFDEVFFMYFEEVDLCYRAYAHGWQVHFMSEAEVIHVGGASTDQQRAIMRLQYFESLAQFYRKHYSKSLRTDLVLIVKTFAFFGLARDFLLLQITRDTGKRSYLRVNLKVHRELLFGHWNKRSDQATVVTA